VGQIAHLDNDASNNSLDNLAFFCLEHHDQYDSRTSQSKGLMIEEARRYRADLKAFVARRHTPRDAEIVTTVTPPLDLTPLPSGFYGLKKGAIPPILLAVIVAFSLLLIGKFLLEAWRSSRTAPQLHARIRISNVEVIPLATPEVPFPGINIYYDNVGTLPASSIASHYGAGFGDGLVAPERIQVAQDDILNWNGWPEEMKTKSQQELHPGDPPQYTSIPHTNNELADNFRNNIKNVPTGKATLYVFIAFKYKDPSMPANVVGVTEECFFFTLNFARHYCGRSRAFLEVRK